MQGAPAGIGGAEEVPSSNSSSSILSTTTERGFGYSPSSSSDATSCPLDAPPPDDGGWDHIGDARFLTIGTGPLEDHLGDACFWSSDVCPSEIPPTDHGGWNGVRDADILRQQFDIKKEEAEKMPCVGDKEPLSVLVTEYQSGDQILLEKTVMLGEHYASIRRTRADGNCFFRCFMFSYLERIMEKQDKAEVDRVKNKIKECRKSLLDLGYPSFTFEEFFESFMEILDWIIQGEETSISHEELLLMSRDQYASDCVVMFFRCVTSGEIRRRSGFFEPFIPGFTNGTGMVDEFCKTSVETMGEESDHIHIVALSEALGVPVRILYLDRSTPCNNGVLSVNHHDFIPSDLIQSAATGNEGSMGDDSVMPFINLLYRPGHYDILYPR